MIFHSTSHDESTLSVIASALNHLVLITISGSTIVNLFLTVKRHMTSAEEAGIKLPLSRIFDEIGAIELKRYRSTVRFSLTTLLPIKPRNNSLILLTAPANVFKAQKVSPIQPSLHHSLYLFAIASTYKILQMYPKMLENCNEALLFKPEDSTALSKAMALGFLKKYTEAIECCDKIIKIDPDDAAAYTSKGLALNELKKYDEALECWKKL